jgi:hypothetical protein
MTVLARLASDRINDANLGVIRHPRVGDGDLRLPIVPVLSTDEQGRLGETVARKERPPFEPSVRKRVRKPGHGSIQDRLGPVERDPPAVELECVVLAGVNAVDAVVDM